ncbi:MAG TPA: Bax inhibitor-1/YccA family protein [Ferruginibacter sp.]|nr:Bax inhibitor-1/YccA family protein [Ferruginibacter sp.]
MNLFKSGNPALSENRFKDSILTDIVNPDLVMSVRGTLQKFGFLLIMLLGSAFYAWKEFAGYGNVSLLIGIGIIGSIVLSLIIVFKKEWSPYLAPAYALCEGLFIGAISAMYQDAFATKAPYIVIQAVGLTFGVAVAMYLLYSFRIIQATQKFKAILFTATAGIALFYLIAIALRYFGNIYIPFLHEGSTFGIIFSLIVTGIAALNLIVDFDMIEQGSAMGAPKFMEWYGAFGLMVTIVWLYLEILRLLAKMNSRK